MVQGRENGYSLVSILVAIAIGTILLLAMNSVVMQDMTFSVTSDVVRLKAEVNEQVHCRNSYYPPPARIYAAACQNNFSYDSTPCGDAPYLPVRNARGEPIFRGWTGEPRSLGAFEVRSCCPSGQLKVEYRILKNGQPMKDRANPQIVYDWASATLPPSALKSYDKGILFPYGSPCGSGSSSTAALNIEREPGNLRVTGAACPGYPFMESPILVLWAYEGIASCKPGYRLIGGGVNCDGMGPLMIPGRSGTADGHPIMEPSMSGPGWVAGANRFGAGCCGGAPPAGSLLNRVYALCERM